MPQGVEDDAIRKLFEAAEVAGFDKDEQLNYFKDMMSERDWEEYIMESKAEQCREIAKAMVEQKLSLETIMTCTGLSKEAILSL